MSHPIDVGSVLGGRYKVTATVLASHDQDLVLDGVDQVLNRPVSILVAGPANASQVAQSAREVATGERPSQMQILDLGVSDATTYLITNHTSPADLLDLAVSSNPPYVEPFFTDTLGSEIFGQARSQEPETYDGLYDDEEFDAGYINYAQHPPQQPVPPSRLPAAGTVPPAPSAALPTPNAPSAPRPAARDAGPAVAAAAAASTTPQAAPQKTPQKAPQTAPQEATPQPVVSQPTAAQPTAAQPTAAQPTVSQPTAAQPTVSQPTAAQPTVSQPRPDGPAVEKPKVSRWSDDDYRKGDAGPENPARQPAPPAAAALDTTDRAPGLFPAAARNQSPAADEDYAETDEKPRREPRSMRWLVGGLLAAMLVAGLVFAVSNLGSLFMNPPRPAADGSSSPGTPTQGSAPPSDTASPTAVATPPVIEGVTRLGDFNFAATYDRDLGRTFDGNGASYWSDMEFGSENWGGFVSEVPLVIKLKSPAEVSSVALSQLGASGGSISVFTNDRPVLEGAKQVGTNSFTSPELTMPLAEPVTAQYVIVSIESLPKLAVPKTRFGYGLRLAEIKIL